MISPTKILEALGLLLLVSAHAQAANADANPLPAVSVTLQVNDSRKLTQSPTEPLLFTVSAANPHARNTNTANDVSARQLDRLKASGDYQKLSPDELKVVNAQLQAKPAAVGNVGQAGHPVTDAFSFIVTNSRGVPVTVHAHALAVDADKLSPATLDSTNSLVLFFGIDPDELSRLPEDTYGIQVAMGVFDSKGGLLPRVHSNVVSVELKKDWAEPSTQQNLLSLYRYGRYYLLDHQYSNVEPYLQKMLALDANAVGAYELQGDMFYGQGKLPEARDSYLKALNLSAAQTRGVPNAESPQYLISRLNEVLVKLRK